MKKMPAGEFKAKCLSVMDKVCATGETVVITKRGKPVAKLVPVKSDVDDIFGFMKDQFTIVGDIESPAIPLEEWDIFKK
jgi:prevent-host-death family protein